MKKKFLLVLSFVVLFFGISSLKSYAQEYSTEEITNFVSDVTFNEDATIDISEEIHYYFPTERHGIYRSIPVDYKTTGAFKRPTQLILNTLYYYPASDSSNTKTAYTEYTNGGYEVFQIGEEDTYVQGEYVYIIEYTLKYALNYFDDHDELYLNITGDEWDVPISSSSVTIHLPAEATDIICYTGPYGSTSQNCSIDDTDKENVVVTLTQPLYSYEGYTVAVSLPKGTVANTEKEQAFQWVLANIGMFLPIPVLIFLIPWVRRNGRNEKITIIPNYHPPKDLFPLLSGFLYSKRLQNKYITADLIDLAVRGYLKIKQLEKNDYELIRTEKKDDDLNDIERDLLEGIFDKEESIKVSKINSSFYKTINKINVNSSKELFDMKLFSNERRKMQTKLIIIGVILTAVVIFLGSALTLIAATGWLIGIIGSGVIVFICAGMVDIRSKDGNEVYYDLLGLRMYIDTAEEKRIEFHNDPKKYIGIFEKLLPYAMIFGLEKKWAKEFEDLYVTPPEWYVGDMNTFNTYMMARAFTRMNSTIQSKSVTPGNSGGFRVSGGASGGSGFSGGSSGGGFGGGGGGSW